VVKPFSGAEVIARIRAILRRASGLADEESPPGPITVGELEVDPASRRARLAGDELTLSRKEFDLLAELVRNAGRVVTREQLMDRVWDVNWFGSTKTLDVHVRWLRQKLGDDPADPRLRRRKMNTFRCWSTLAGRRPNPSARRGPGSRAPASRGRCSPSPSSAPR
jgi:two-component system, OmpR family, response regulator RegX3